jgi:hypothetical protein
MSTAVPATAATIPTPDTKVAEAPSSVSASVVPAVDPDHVPMSDKDEKQPNPLTSANATAVASKSKALHPTVDAKAETETMETDDKAGSGDEDDDGEGEGGDSSEDDKEHRPEDMPPSSDEEEEEPYDEAAVLEGYEMRKNAMKEAAPKKGAEFLAIRKEEITEEPPQMSARKLKELNEGLDALLEAGVKPAAEFLKELDPRKFVAATLKDLERVLLSGKSGSGPFQSFRVRFCAPEVFRYKEAVVDADVSLRDSFEQHGCSECKKLGTPSCDLCKCAFVLSLTVDDEWFQTAFEDYESVNGDAPWTYKCPRSPVDHPRVSRNVPCCPSCSVLEAIQVCYQRNTMDEEKARACLDDVIERSLAVEREDNAEDEAKQRAEDEAEQAAIRAARVAERHAARAKARAEARAEKKRAADEAMRKRLCEPATPEELVKARARATTDDLKVLELCCPVHAGVLHTTVAGNCPYCDDGKRTEWQCNHTVKPCSCQGRLYIMRNLAQSGVHPVDQIKKLDGRISALSDDINELTKSLKAHEKGTQKEVKHTQKMYNDLGVFVDNAKRQRDKLNEDWQKKVDKESALVNSVGPDMDADLAAKTATVAVKNAAVEKAKKAAQKAEDDLQKLKKTFEDDKARAITLANEKRNAAVTKHKWALEEFDQKEHMSRSSVRAYKLALDKIHSTTKTLTDSLARKNAELVDLQKIREEDAADFKLATGQSHIGIKRKAQAISKSTVASAPSGTIVDTKAAAIAAVTSAVAAAAAEVEVIDVESASTFDVPDKDEKENVTPRTLLAFRAVRRIAPGTTSKSDIADASATPVSDFSRVAAKKFKMPNGSAMRADELFASFLAKDSYDLLNSAAEVAAAEYLANSL